MSIRHYFLVFLQLHFFQVEVQVDSIDKGGNFIGWMFVDNVNLSVALVENGLAKMHFTAERSSYFKELEIAQERAKTKKIGIWQNYVEEVQDTPVVEDSERKTNYKKVRPALPLFLTFFEI